MAKKMTPPPQYPTAAIEQKLRHAMSQDSRLTVILNGHLALEYGIEASCKKGLVAPKELFEDHNFGFSMKLKLLKGLFGKEIDASVYTTCGKLNTLRNELAHRLASSKIQKLHFELLELSLPSMKGKTKVQLETMDSEALTELTFYKIHAIIREILKVSFKGELDAYDTQMGEWSDTNK